MIGVWLNKSEAAAACELSPHFFLTKKAPYLRTKKVKKRTLFFVPQDDLTEMARKNYGSQLCMLDDEAEQVEDVLGDVTYTDQGSELTAARLDNLKARTALINEKLAQRKEQLFSEWSERFFLIFSDSFAKFKNSLIDIHLDETQLAVLNEKLETALKSMEDKLTQINEQWLNEDIEDDKA